MLFLPAVMEESRFIFYAVFVELLVKKLFSMAQAFCVVLC